MGRWDQSVVSATCGRCLFTDPECPAMNCLAREIVFESGRTPLGKVLRIRLVAGVLGVEGAVCHNDPEDTAEPANN